MEPEGAGWYVVLPGDGTAACLGLLDKYAGFTAVESVQEDDGHTTVVLHAAGTVGWASDRAPRKVLLNASDVTGQVERDGAFYTLPLPESGERAVLTILS